MQTARLSEDPKEHDAAFEAMGHLFGAILSTLEPAVAGQVLTALAAGLAQEDDDVLPLADGVKGNREKRRARSWLRDRLPGWLARYGPEPVMRRKPRRLPAS